MLKSLVEKINNKSSLLNFYTDIENKKNISIFDASFNVKTLLLNQIESPLVFITESYDLINKLKEQFESLGKRVSVVLSSDFDIKINAYSQNENINSMIETMIKVLNNQVDVVLITPKVLFQKLPSKSQFIDNSICFEKSRIIGFNTISQKLIKMGYKKVEVVENTGEFAVRGDIVDIFPISESLPIRIEFFDDEIETISQFTTENYSKVKEINKIRVFSNTLCFIDNNSQLFERLDKELSKAKLQMNNENYIKLKTNVENLKFRLDSFSYHGIENFLIPFLSYSDNLLSFIGEKFFVVFDDVRQLIERVNYYEDEFLSSFELLISNGECFNVHKDLIFKKEKVFVCNNQKLSFQSINSASKIFNPDAVYSFRQSVITNYYGKYDLLFEELKYYLEFNNTVLIFAKNNETSVYLNKFLLSKNMQSHLISNYSQVEINKVNILPKTLLYGAHLVDEKLVLIGTNELLGKQDVLKAKKKTKREVFSLPKIGDYVVHDIFGIGKCVGIERRKFASFEKDYIVLKYDGGDKLYLPTEQIGLISSYVSTSEKQKLSKLGSQEFLKVKQRVKNSVKEMAFSLLQLYAERERQKGFKYAQDDELMKEFESSFPYQTTLDQQEAIDAVKNDMIKGKLMDRLICGDVGYGKTEVALRAIFKAVESGKQVAFLAPTTVLSEQHYNTCFSRMNNFMVKVAVLNRFKTSKEQKEILKQLKQGEIDVIIGTHRLLSKDVEFKDLGLLVLDEEQRFGVQDKEKIKNIKKSIDVLTLSATPIPRTLHLSLSGIRDISLITTAPEGRLPVQTSVTEFSNVLLKQALEREINRGGQAIVVYNSIEHIYSLAQTIKLLLGENVVVSVAHGQMDEKTLENEIYNLYNGKTQVLVSTTLIENGIDLPNCNTLIVKNADHLGLSQLYQLRGRVGRANKLGYAYFTYENNKVMTEDAYKRLNALMEFTELGSGFKIALRDLEIRGSGNIIGKEQHGHMDKVGYDMYCKLLSEAVSELKGEKLESEKEVKIDVSISAFIPDDYIIDSDARFRVYNKFLPIKSEQDRIKVIEDIKDIYGKNLPIEVDNLSKISLLRYYAQKLDVKRVQITQSKVALEFYQKESLLKDQINQALFKSNLRYVLSFASEPIIYFEMDDLSITKKLDNILTFFGECVTNF